MSLFTIENQLCDYTESKKKLCGLVTVTEGIIFDLNCLFCSEVTDNFIEFIAHIISNHISNLQEIKENLVNQECNERATSKFDPRTDTHEKTTATSDESDDEKCNPNPNQKVYSTTFDQDDDTKSYIENDTLSDEFEVEAILNEDDILTDEEEKEDIQSQTDLFENTTDDEIDITDEMPSFELVKVSYDNEEDPDSENNQMVMTKTYASTSAEREEIEYLIHLYKEHPVLWDYRTPGYSSSHIKNKAYVEISEEMNLKFNNPLSPKTIKRIVFNLRCKFRKEFERMANSEDTVSNLWFYQMFSFTLLEDFQEKEKIEYMIDLYKEYPVLWDYRTPGYSSSHIKNNAYAKIAKAMNEKFDYKFTAKKIKQQMLKLCSKFKKEYHNISTKKIDTSNLWFFERLSFIAGYDISCEENLFEGKELLLSNEKKQTEYLIDLYKQYPILWDQRIDGSTEVTPRNKAYAEIANEMRKKFKDQLVIEKVKRCVFNLRSKFIIELLDMVKNRRTSSRLWFFDQLSFIMEDNADDNKKNTFMCPQVINIKHLMQFEENKNSNLDFIEFYKNCPCLWDKQNPDYTNQQKRENAHDFLIKSMKNKWNIALTEKQLLQKIAIIKFLYNAGKLYQRTMRSDCNSDEFSYFEKLNFLKRIKKEKKTIENTEEYQCEMCPEKFMCESKLKDHLYVEHDIMSFACDVCSKVFPSSAAMKRHVKIHVTIEDRPFACQFCGAKFVVKSACSEHERRHTKKFLHSCNICPKKFVASTDLKIHMRTHTGEKPYLCPECGKLFRNYSSLSCHRKRHLGLRTHNCTICPKAFYSSNALRRHLKSHSNVRDNICNVCGKGFKVRSTLRQHMLLHSDEKKYSCKICERSFAQYGGLHGHMKTHGIRSALKEESIVESNIDNEIVC